MKEASIQLPKSTDNAKAFLQSGQFEDALKSSLELIEHYPDWGQAYSLATTCYRRLNQAEQEIQLAAVGACSVHEGRHLFLRHAFEVFMRHKKFYMALTIGREFSRSSNRKPEFLIKEPMVLIELGNIMEANKILSNLQIEFPDDSTILQCVAQACKVDGKIQKAIKIYEKLIELSANNWPYCDELVSLLLTQGKARRAERVCLESYSRKGSSPLDSCHQERRDIHVMQYFHHNKKTSRDNDEQDQIQLINSKLKLQWKCSFHGNGTYQLIGRDQAAENIEKWFGAKARKLFNSCALPAMQADFLRVAFLAQQTNSLYIDWPHRPVNPEGLYAQVKLMRGKSLLATRFRGGKQGLWNGFAFNNSESDISSYFCLVMEKMIDNMVQRVSNNVWAVTGPGVWIEALKEFKEKDGLIDYVVFPEDLKEHFRPAFDKRKNFSNHWSVVQQSQSIFLD